MSEQAIQSRASAPAPVGLRRPEPLPSPEVWSVRGLRLPATRAIDEIRGNGKIPEEDKAWIIRKIQKSGFEGVIVDAHEHHHQGVTIMHGSVTKLF